jgi:GMP synthase-like glutamine amidotransferase
MAIIVFQHDEANRPGRLGRVLRDHAHRLDVRRLDLGDGFPPDFDNVTGVVSLGGHQNLSDAGTDAAPWMSHEMAFLREASARHLPVIGVCLGAQLVAAAMGGEVEPMTEAEVGFHPITLTPAGHVETSVAGVAWEHRGFCHHGQQITKLPVQGTLLASSAACKIQAFRTDLRTYGYQWHLEADRDMALEINRAAGEDAIDESQLLEQWEAHGATFERLSERICVNLASHVAPAGKLVGVSGGR